MQEQVGYFKHHLYVKNQQKLLYEKSIKEITSTSCVIVMDFKENVKIGGGPVETSNNFYEKTQVSVLGFSVSYLGEDLQPRVHYFDFFSKILSHDSLFVKECILKLLKIPFMNKFSKFCFWSDCGPHFRSGELINFFLEDLNLLYPRNIFYLNYFAEYHGKSIVDGHFGLLSRWLSDGEATREIKTIDELMGWFQYKIGTQQTIQNGRPLQATFLQYERLHGRGSIKKLIIENFKCYMSFIPFQGKLYVSPLSTLNSENYVIVEFKVKIEKDKRKTKFAPERKTNCEILNIFGSKSLQTLLTRIELIQQVPIDNTIPMDLSL